MNIRHLGEPGKGGSRAEASGIRLESALPRKARRTRSVRPRGPRSATQKPRGTMRAGNYRSFFERRAQCARARARDRRKRGKSPRRAHCSGAQCAEDGDWKARERGHSIGRPSRAALQVKGARRAGASSSRRPVRRVTLRHATGTRKKANAAGSRRWHFNREARGRRSASVYDAPSARFTTGATATGFAAFLRCLPPAGALPRRMVRDGGVRGTRARGRY